MAVPKSGDKGGGAFRPLVAFDFDGTLTVRDSFVDFLAWRAGSLRFWLGLARLGPAGLGYLADRDRERLKYAVVGEFLRGVLRSELEGDARRHAAARSSRLIRPDALRAWRLWRDRGAVLVIVTASPGITVAPFASDLGADLLLGSRLAFDAQDRVTGGLEGANCRGAEKVVRLRAAFGDDVRLEAAYGDSAGDREMLDLAREPHYREFGART